MVSEKTSDIQGNRERVKREERVIKFLLLFYLNSPHPITFSKSKVWLIKIVLLCLFFLYFALHFCLDLEPSTLDKTIHPLITIQSEVLKLWKSLLPSECTVWVIEGWEGQTPSFILQSFLLLRQYFLFSLRFLSSYSRATKWLLCSGNISWVELK